MKVKLMEFLITQDHFGITPCFLYKGKPQFHSIFCEIFSLIMNILCVVVFFTQISELLKKTNPTVNFVSLQQSKGPNGTLNTENLMISFGILNQQFEFFSDPTYLTFEALYEYNTIENGKFSTTQTKLNQINCTEVNYQTYEEYGYGNVFLSNSLQNYYCYENSINDKKVIIGGIFGSEFYGCIHAILKKCQ